MLINVQTSLEGRVVLESGAANAAPLRCLKPRRSRLCDAHYHAAALSSLSASSLFHLSSAGDPLGPGRVQFVAVGLQFHHNHEFAPQFAARNVG
jgi:hypothetical protein